MRDLLTLCCSGRCRGWLTPETGRARGGDSGVRSAADVFKCVALFHSFLSSTFPLARVSLADPQRSPSSRHRALSLGAQFVFVGRPWVYGMSINGAAGVRHVMRALLAEYDILLNVAGWTSTDEVKREGRKYLVRTGAGGGFKL